jgi:hypothetical protein
MKTIKLALLHFGSLPTNIGKLINISMKKLNLPISFLSIGLFGLMMSLPASAQPYQTYPKINPNDPNEELPWNPTPGRLEAACQVTANFNTCLTYYQLWCGQGFQKACSMSNLAATNPQLFQQAITANSACTRGDQSACNWLMQRFGN